MSDICPLRPLLCSSKIAVYQFRIRKIDMIKTVEWTKEGVRMLDQRLLPTEEKYVTLYSYEEVADAIKNMVVRGAPAIGVAAAMGLALGATQSVGTSLPDLE